MLPRWLQNRNCVARPVLQKIRHGSGGCTVNHIIDFRIIEEVDLVQAALSFNKTAVSTESSERRKLPAAALF